MSETNPPLGAHAAAPHAPPDESGAPLMSTPETLSGIFFEPGRTFEALRSRPRFLVAGLIIIASFMIFYVLFIQKIGMEAIAEAQVRARQPDVTQEELSQIVGTYSNPFVRAITYLVPLIGFLVVFAAGAGLYVLGVMVLGKSIGYRQALSVWVYSMLPPTVLVMIANLLLLFIQSPDKIDPARDVNRGLVHANPSLLVDAAARPALATALGALDLFQIYGLFLAATGLRKVARLSTGAAWGIVLGIWLLGVIMRTSMAAMLGTAY